MHAHVGQIEYINIINRPIRTDQRSPSSTPSARRNEFTGEVRSRMPLQQEDAAQYYNLRHQTL